MPGPPDTTGAARSAAALAASWRSACDCRDPDALVSLYEDRALLVAPTGEVLEGRPAMRDTLSGLVAAAVPARYRRNTRRSLEADGVALFVDSWGHGPGLAVPHPDAESLGLMVARRQPDGTWLIAIDVPHGTI